QCLHHAVRHPRCSITTIFWCISVIPDSSSTMQVASRQYGDLGLSFVLKLMLPGVPMSLFRYFSTRTLFTALTAMFLAISLAACGKSEAKLQDIHGVDLSGTTFGDGFQLKDADGNVRTLEDFEGKVVMMFFGFTQCPDVCPTALVNATQIKSLLGEKGDDLQVLFITVDPERDTPEVLREYTQAFDPSFIGLYGNAEETAAV